MNDKAPLQQVKPRNARSARALKAREPQATEHPKSTLFLRYTNYSNLQNLLIIDLFKLKQPSCVRLTKKNTLHPFEDAGSFEFFSNKNDASLLVFGSHSKKRPHALTFMRTFDYKMLDMIELLTVPETLRTMSQFKKAKMPAVGLKPIISFAGTPFESPTATEYALAKSILLDFFKGPDTHQIDVEGLQYMISISAEDEVDGHPPPEIHIRCYLIKTMRSGARLPRVEVEEMGPRVDFRVGRFREADTDAWREAMKRPKGVAPKAKKNIETDALGDKVAKIHTGRQDLTKLQSRKMKGLKRSRDLDIDVVDEGIADMDVGGRTSDDFTKKPRI